MTQTSKNTRVRKPKISQSKKNIFLLGFILILGFVALSVLGKNGILDLIKLQGVQHTLEKENEDLMAQQEELKAEIARLQNPDYIESLARERFGLMRHNEVFLILDSQASPSPQ